MKKIYIRENQINKDLLLPQFLFKAVRAHDTSLGDNPAFPSEDNYAFDYTILKERYRDVYEKMHELGIPTNINTDELTTVLGKMVTVCREIEKPVRDSLEKICENTVNRIFAIPDGVVNIKCKLVDNISYKISVSVTPEVSSGDAFKFKDINDFELSKSAVAKRRFVNALVMGASKIMMGYKEYYQDELNKINPELMPLYDKIMALNEYLLFITKEQMTDERPKQGSYVEVYVGGNGKKSTIEAQGVIFPLLLHDTLKGLFELFSVHGLPEDKDKREYIIKKSDFLLAEPWDMRLGVPLWNRVFGRIGEANIIPYIFMYLIKLPTEEFNQSMKELLMNTERGDEIMHELTVAAQHNDGYQKFKKRINARNVDRAVIADSYFTAAELDGFNIDGEENDGDVIEEDTAEFVNWEGKKYGYSSINKNPMYAFLVLDNNGKTHGEVIVANESAKSHEELILRYCYALLGKEVPLNELGDLYYMQAVDDIEKDNKPLFNNIIQNIKIQGRMFVTDEGDYVFTARRPVEESDAIRMMNIISLRKEIPREKCYYVGHEGTMILPLVSK